MFLVVFPMCFEYLDFLSPLFLLPGQGVYNQMLIVEKIYWIVQIGDCYKIDEMKRSGGFEWFREVRGACRIQNLKKLSKSEVMGPSYDQNTE